ncbi:hypothetical protein J4T85_019510 [Sinorhizobium medicae]|uniref:hypothetical protein n=1 Tax=Sinorhizobium medicae TaxID=110321 RepID=UPI001AAFA72B|nr:hypothetical protein [Sinorhizobium medicae]MBO1963873.1 hypothetical protein [Sinorhizobium medicae]
MSVRNLVEIYQFIWMVESHGQQRLAWHDAADARVARARAEERAEAQLQAMLIANPSGALGHAAIDDEEALRKAGLL